MRIAQILGIALGVLITIVGLVGIAAPSVLLEFGRSLQTPNALFLIAALRIALGALLIWAASASRVPRTLRVIGAIVVVAGLFTPLFGIERVQAVLTWWAQQGQVFMRAIPGVAVVIGGFLMYAFAVRYPCRASLQRGVRP
jgi:hypothetical protein